MHAVYQISNLRKSEQGFLPFISKSRTIDTIIIWTCDLPVHLHSLLEFIFMNNIYRFSLDSYTFLSTLELSKNISHAFFSPVNFEKPSGRVFFT